MARLIDVEPFDFISFQGTGDTAYDQGFEDGVQFIAEKLDAAPTIDAIPMWWITEKFLDVLNKDKDLSKAVWMVRKAWQKEQEAR